MDMAELFFTEYLAEIQMIQNNVKLKRFKKEDSDKVPWKVTAETSMQLKTDSLSLDSSEKARLKANTNLSELMELQFKRE